MFAVAQKNQSEEGKNPEDGGQNHTQHRSRRKGGETSQPKLLATALVERLAEWRFPVKKTEQQNSEIDRKAESLKRRIQFVDRGIAFQVADDSQQEQAAEGGINRQQHEEVRN